MTDGTLQTVLLALLKFGAALALIYLWIMLVKNRIVPAFKTQEEGASNKKLPILKTLVLVFITGAAIWLSQIEFVHRKPADKPRPGSSQRLIENSRPSGTLPEIPPDRQETLAERTARMKAEADAQNQQARDDFIRNNAPQDK